MTDLVKDESKGPCYRRQQCHADSNNPDSLCAKPVHLKALVHEPDKHTRKGPTGQVPMHVHPEARRMRCLRAQNAYHKPFRLQKA